MPSLSTAQKRSIEAVLASKPRRWCKLFALCLHNSIPQSSTFWQDLKRLQY
jgi:hypothetical protein